MSKFVKLDNQIIIPGDPDLTHVIVGNTPAWTGRRIMSNNAVGPDIKYLAYMASCEGANRGTTEPPGAYEGWERRRWEAMSPFTEWRGKRTNPPMYGPGRIIVNAKRAGHLIAGTAAYFAGQGYDGVWPDNNRELVNGSYDKTTDSPADRSENIANAIGVIREVWRMVTGKDPLIVMNASDEWNEQRPDTDVFYGGEPAAKASAESFANLGAEPYLEGHDGRKTDYTFGLILAFLKRCQEIGLRPWLQLANRESWNAKAMLAAAGSNVVTN